MISFQEDSNMMKGNNRIECYNYNVYSVLQYFALKNYTQT